MPRIVTYSTSNGAFSRVVRSYVVCVVSRRPDKLASCLRTKNKPNIAGFKPTGRPTVAGSCSERLGYLGD